MSNVELYEDQALPAKPIKSFSIKNEKHRHVILILLMSIFLCATVVMYVVNISKKPLQPNETVERARGLNQNFYGPQK